MYRNRDAKNQTKLIRFSNRDTIKLLFHEDTLMAYYQIAEKKGNIYIFEYCIDPNLNREIHEYLEQYILYLAQKEALRKSKDKVFLHLFPNYPLAHRVIKLGGHDNSGLFSSMMVKILNLDCYLEKLIAFQNEVRIPQLSFAEIENSFPCDFHLQCEEKILQFYCKIQKGNQSVEIQYNPDKLKGESIQITREFLGVMSLLNFLPSDLVESEYLVCSESVLKILDIIFSPLNSFVYPINKF
jgi:hypothetical protein